MSDEEKPQPLVFVDPDPVSRSASEDLEDEFDRPVVAIDSMDFGEDASEEVLEAEAFIVCWDLGFRCGADMIEMIRADENLCDRIVLVAMESPTKALVRTALRHGADGVCRLPYDHAEITQRLEATRSARMATKAA